MKPNHYGYHTSDMTLRLNGVRVAKLTTPEGTKPCGRCGGSGQYGHYGTCFDCGGHGYIGENG